MVNLELTGVKELTQENLLNYEGGFWIGPTPQWVIDAAIAAGEAVDAFIEGVKAGTELF